MTGQPAEPSARLSVVTAPDSHVADVPPVPDGGPSVPPVVENAPQQAQGMPVAGAVTALQSIREPEGAPDELLRTGPLRVPFGIPRAMEEQARGQRALTPEGQQVPSIPAAPRPDTGIRPTPDLALARTSQAGTGDIGMALARESHPGVPEENVLPDAAPVSLPPTTPDAPAVPDDLIITIRPGDSLWTIASRVYGGGVRYREIFEANRQEISNPHWIYPGQVLHIPRPAPPERTPASGP